jgi:hypothetical protein
MDVGTCLVHGLDAYLDEVMVHVLVMLVHDETHLGDVMVHGLMHGLAHG